MKKNAETFLKKTLGEDFLESLEKFDLWKPDTKSVTDHNELFQGLNIVPKVLLSLLARELTPMQIEDHKEIKLPVASDSVLKVTKHGPDVYSGEIIDNNKKLTEFKFRPIPGVGLVIMSAYELYDLENLDKPPTVAQDKEEQINKLIDERMQLHSLINRVVDGKLMQRDAIHQLLMAKINQPVPAPVVEAKEVPKVETPVKKSLPLADFVEKRKNKLAKKEYSVELAKGETKDCPDCGQTIFNGSGISSCLCFGESKKVYLKKTEDGIKVSFGPKWDVENIEMLLEILRNKK